MGDPFAALAWLARRLSERGSGLSAGDLVSVSGCTDLAQVLPGQTPSGRFGDLGTVSLDLRSTPGGRFGAVGDGCWRAEVQGAR